jgi:tetratricopeptide (TPR) repeat protein
MKRSRWPIWLALCYRFLGCAKIENFMVVPMEERDQRALERQDFAADAMPASQVLVHRPAADTTPAARLPKYIVVDRRDLFGGRLIALLNGLRLAELYGLKFLMTWYTDASVFQSYVAGLREIFAGPLVEPFDEATGGGTVVPISHPILKSASSGVHAVPVPEVKETGIGDIVVEPKFGDADEAYLLNRRFSFYRATPSEDLRTIRQSISRIFNALPKAPVLKKHLDELARARIDRSRTVSIHVRRLHWTSGSPNEVDRFDSYVDTSFVYALIDRLKHEADRILLASDSQFLVHEVQDRCRSSIVTLDDLIDTTGTTPLQRTVLDMAFLGQGSTVFAPMSALAISAAAIGNAEYRNILRFAAQERLPGNDVTMAVEFLRREQEGRLPALRTAMLERPNAVICMRLAHRMPQAEGAAELALMGLAVRFIAHEHPSFQADWRPFLMAVRASASGENILKVLGWIEDRLAADAKSIGIGDRPMSALLPQLDPKLALVVKTVEADLAVRARVWSDAASSYEDGIRLAQSIGLRPTGLVIRLAKAQRAAGDVEGELSSLRRAVELDPGYAISWHRLGMALLERAQAAEAEQPLRKATELDPYTAIFWRGLSLALEAQKRFAAAEKAMRNAEWCDPAALSHHDVKKSKLLAPTPTPYALAEEVSFARHGSGVGFLRTGFSVPEGWGVWTVEPQARIEIPAPPHGRLLLWLRFQAFTRNKAGPPAGFRLKVNRHAVGEFAPCRGQWGEIYERMFEIPAEIMNRPAAEIEFDILYHRTPEELTANDPRLLGIGLISAKLMAA